MTPYLIKLISRLSLGCLIIVLLMRAFGWALPPEEEILFSRYNGQDYDIYRMSLTRHIAAALVNTPSDEWEPQWSHDGQSIAFIRYDELRSVIYLMDSRGLGLHRLTNRPRTCK